MSYIRKEERVEACDTPVRSDTKFRALHMACMHASAEPRDTAGSEAAGPTRRHPIAWDSGVPALSLSHRPCCRFYNALRQYFATSGYTFIEFVSVSPTPFVISCSVDSSTDQISTRPPSQIDYPQIDGRAANMQGITDAVSPRLHRTVSYRLRLPGSANDQNH